MSTNSEYKCCECQEWHPRQAFISHAGKDEAIAKEAARVCCAAQVKPYRFEDSAEFSMPAIDNARTIAEEIINSDIFLVVLSPSVSGGILDSGLDRLRDWRFHRSRHSIQGAEQLLHRQDSRLYRTSSRTLRSQCRE